MFIDLLVDSLINHLPRFVRWNGSSGQHNQYQSPQNPDHATETGSQGHNRELHLPGFFNHANNVTIANSTMAENFNVISMGKPALEHLAPYTEPGAAMDSSARDPPPKCHPGTRLKIGGKLQTWLDNLKRPWNMMWLCGPAGTGKSAVAQTFAEYCYERGRLGAAFFFSRPNKRNKPESVIPTLAYQLAVQCRSFNTILTDQLASDPQLLTKAPRVQLKKLIIEPLLILQTHKHERIREPFMIILDGLDECEGEDPQFEFVSMINKAAELKNLPLLWLICSRPEAHLEYSFSKVAYCGREVLLLDQECRDDVDLYLRDELARIKDEYADTVPSLWPSKDQFDELSWFSSGLFIFASTGVKYIGDRTCANPVKQLKKLLSILKRAEAIGANSPLANLDLLYTQILIDVSDESLPTTWQILAYYIYIPVSANKMPAQHLCNFLRISQSDFYSALRRLHSVIAVPSPDDAFEVPLRFHHTSFQNFLWDPNRLGKFVIERRNALVDIAKLGLFWHSVDTTHFHTDEGWDCTWQEHRHASLPNLEWVSPNNEKDISTAVANIAMRCNHIFYHLSDEGIGDEDLSSCIRDLDFRYVHRRYFPELADWLYEQNPSDPIVRTQPSNELDIQLLEYLRAIIGQEHVDPATFPWGYPDLPSGPGNALKRNKLAEGGRAYFFIGHGERTIIVLIARNQDYYDPHTLNLDKGPSLQRIIRYQDSLVASRWDESANQEGEGVSAESGTNDPLVILSRLYTQMLTDVPQEYFPTTQRILAYCIYIPMVVRHGKISAQVLCNFLRIGRNTFYNALRGLHPVIAIPTPEDASEVPLHFHGPTFEHFLLDANHSGKLVIDEEKTWADIAKSALFWHSIDTACFHTNDGWDFDYQHQHASLPNLEWVSPDNETDVSKGVANLAVECWHAFHHLSEEKDEDLASYVRSLDFRYVHHSYFPDLANWLYKQDPSDSIVRTIPSNRLDEQLLSYIRATIGQGRMGPAIIPCKRVNHPPGVGHRVYFFIGRGAKTAIVLLVGYQDREFVRTLNLDKEPFPRQIIGYQASLIKYGLSESANQEGKETSAENRSNNPLAAPTDLFYTQILADVPQEYLPTTQRILAYIIYIPIATWHYRIPAQVLCNFLCINESTFYSALEKLQSVIIIPTPEQAHKVPLRFRHTSFLDFLLDVDRSGRFVIDEQKALVDIAKSSLFWHGVGMTCFHTNDGWNIDYQHWHASLPNLEWVSPDNKKDICKTIIDLTMRPRWSRYCLSGDEDLVSCVRKLDFRYVPGLYFPDLADWLYRQDPSDPIVRTTPSNELDMRLLGYLRTVIGQGHADPITFPWKWDTWHPLSSDRDLENTTGDVKCRLYFFIGQGEKTIIVLLTGVQPWFCAHTLNLDKEPSLRQIISYQDLLVTLKWGQAPKWEEEEELSMESGANNPLTTLDRLHTQILTNVPEEPFPATQRILAYLSCITRMGVPNPPAQVLCNFLCMDKSTFYSAVQKLHPAILVPALEDASKVPLVSSGRSFWDFLLDPNRSGRFVIDKKKAWADITKSALFWHSIDATCFHTNDGWDFDREHRHTSLPGLKWVSPDDETDVSEGVANFAINCGRAFYHLSDEKDEDLASHVHSLDFRYVHPSCFPQLANWLYKQNYSDPIVRMKPSNGLDMRLLVYMRAVICQARAEPAQFPWRWLAGMYRVYFFVGHGEKTIIVLITANENGHLVHTLNLDKEPSPQQIEVYQDWLVRLKWNEAPDWEGDRELSAESEANNPLVPPTDLLYTQILAHVPQEYLPITQRILAYFIYLPIVGRRDSLRIPAQVLCNYLCIDRSTFYSAFQMLHAIIAIPAPEDASKSPLYFRHASFLDFLLDSDRSGRFAIDERNTWVDIAKSSLFWQSIDARFHASDGWDFDYEHRHASLPDLEWVSPDNENTISTGVANLAMGCWDVFSRLSDERNEDLSSRVRDFDFRYMPCHCFWGVADWLYKQVVGFQ